MTWSVTTNDSRGFTVRYFDDVEQAYACYVSLGGGILTVKDMNILRNTNRSVGPQGWHDPHIARCTKAESRFTRKRGLRTYREAC